MGSIRTLAGSGALFLDFRHLGKRCREYTALLDTPANRKRVEKNGISFKEAINSTIRDGLVYADTARAKEKKRFKLTGRLLRSKAAFNFHKAQQLAEVAENDPDFRW